MENTFDLVMEKRSDEELYEIFTRFKLDYQPDAVTAAKETFKNRGLSNAQINEIQENLNRKQEHDVIISKEGLHIIPTILFPILFAVLVIRLIVMITFRFHQFAPSYETFLNFSIVLVSLLIASRYESKNQDRKYRDIWFILKIGFGVYFLLLLVLYAFFLPGA